MKLWTNGYFHTMEDSHKIYRSMTTDMGLIAGFNQTVDEIMADEIIDLKGGHVYPGFVDAHMHLLGYGQMLSRPNLGNLKTKTEVIDAIRKDFKDNPLFCQGYFECGLTKEDLNAISLSHPIYVRHNDYHSITVNDVVLKRMGHTHPTGVLTEHEADLAMRTYPTYAKKDLEKLLESAIETLYRYGITGAHSDDLYYFNGFFETLDAFESVLNRLPFRAHLLMHHEVIDDYVTSQRPFLDQSAYLQLGAVKMFYDGTISSKTALMKSLYKGTDHHGIIVNTRAGFIALVTKARSLGLPVAIHVIGDQGLEDVINILIDHPPKKGAKDRLIHTPWVSKSSLKALAALNLSIDIQPQFLSSDLPWALDLFETMPDLAFPWKTLLEKDINLAGSSDAPVEIPNPLLGIFAAVERRSRHDHNVYFPEESLSRFEAIRLYTTYAQYHTEKTNRGLLKIGHIADLTVFKHDLELMESALFHQDIVSMTVVDEKIVYKGK